MSESFLSQEEVDALLEGVTGESQKVEKEVPATDGVRGYNLSNQERIVRGRMPTMEIVNERFSRNLRLGLFNFIRKSPEITVGTVKAQKYSAFLRELVVPTNFNIMAVRPLRGNGLVVCEPTLLFGVMSSKTVSAVVGVLTLLFLAQRLLFPPHADSPPPPRWPSAWA